MFKINNINDLKNIPLNTTELLFEYKFNKPVDNIVFINSIKKIKFNSITTRLI